MSNGQQSADTLHDNSIGWIILFVILAVLIWLFWMFFDHEVRNIIRWIRYGEMWVMSFFIPSDYTFFFEGRDINWQASFAGYDVQTAKGIVHVNGVDEYEKGKMTIYHMSKFSAMAMGPLKWIFVAILGAGAYWCYTLGPRTQFRNKLGIEALISRQSKVFPVISPFVKFNPSTQPPRPPGAPVPAELPLFGEALGPEEWLAYNNVSVPDGKIDEESAEDAFVKQLGRSWRGVKGLEPYKRVLLAAFCLKAARKRIDSDDILGRVAQCWSFAGGLDLSKDKTLLKEADAILGNKKLSGNTLAQCNRHAYETTAMIRALQFAREEGGVLAPATFVWLRAHDRTLWYPLNNMGRQSFHMEALGAMSHFKAEKMTQRPIPVAKVDFAVRSIAEYMKSARARPIPQLDYSKSKKRGVKKAT